ncbi:hypothetical protein D3C86_2047950 [compost metagenome]
MVPLTKFGVLRPSVLLLNWPPDTLYFSCPSRIIVGRLEKACLVTRRRPSASMTATSRSPFDPVG